MPPPGVGQPVFDQSWFPPPLRPDQNECFYNFLAGLLPDQISSLLTIEGQQIYASIHMQTTGGWELPLNHPALSQAIPPLGGWQTTNQQKTNWNTQKSTNDAKEKGEDGEQDKTKEFGEGAEWFSRWEEWHELQLAINAGNRKGQDYVAALSEWKVWVHDWRLLHETQKQIIGLRKELDKLDKQEKSADGNDLRTIAADKVKFKSHMDAEIAKVDARQWLPEEEEDEDAEEEDRTSEKKEKRLLEAGLWDLFKQKSPPPWQVDSEPAGMEWWAGRVVKLSQNLNVHMASGITYKENPYTRAIQKEIQDRDNEVKVRIFEELKGSTRDLVKHVDGHHVLKEVLATTLQKNIKFIMDDILDGKEPEEYAAEWVKLAKQKYGCRVLIKMLSHMHQATVQPIIDALVANAAELAKHKYGHWVIGCLVEDQKFWDEGYKQASTKLIETLTAHVEILMTPEPEKKASAPDNQPAPTAGSKKGNNNQDCNGAAVLDKAMKNPDIPVDISKSLYRSVLQHEVVLADMGCTRFGVEAAKRALGAYTEKDGMTEDPRVDNSQKDVALAYLRQQSVVSKLNDSRYGRVLNGFVNGCPDEEGSDAGH